MPRPILLRCFFFCSFLIVFSLDKKNKREKHAIPPAAFFSFAFIDICCCFWNLRTVGMAHLVRPLPGVIWPAFFASSWWLPKGKGGQAQLASPSFFMMTSQSMGAETHRRKSNAGKG